LDETRDLIARYGDSPVFEALGYKQARDVLSGKLARERLAEEISLHTRRFAKRQMTYWRNEPRKRGWAVMPGSGEGDEVAGFDSFPHRAQKRMKSFRALSVTTQELTERVRARMAAEQLETEVWYVRVG
jgi:tRNA A37 N6-isopentenylltransferase MiaA